MTVSVLRTEKLVKRYGMLTAVKELSFEVFEGEIFGFLGPNGAGKTTTIHMICGLTHPDAGQVLVEGQSLAQSGAAGRSRIGMCPQNIVLWEKLTCLEQLQFMGEMYGVAGREARRRGERLLEELELGEKRNKQAHTLSGGMKRRLNLAMALVHDPDILVLDEPEVGLDPQSRVKVRETIRSLAHRKTVILTTHDMDEADRLAERVAIIDHGELLVLDTPQALKERLGSGDVVEIRLLNPVDTLETFREALGKIAGEVTLEKQAASANNPYPLQILRVRAMHAAAKLPALLEILTQHGVQAGELSLRPNSLEDVFIQLTGRRLRE